MSEIDVRALAKKAEFRDAWLSIYQPMLDEFASLVLEEAAKVCDHRIATNPGDDVRNFEAQMIAEWVRELKPVQS